MHKPALNPNDLEKLFVERANAGDIDGLVALYETDATLVTDDGRSFTGAEQIREFLTDYLADRPTFKASDQSPAIVSGDIALTSSRHSDGTISAEVARRQVDGGWLWVVDNFALAEHV